MCVRELGTSPMSMRGKKGGQHKESNKQMLYLGDIKQSKSYQVSVSKRSEIARPEKEKMWDVEFLKGEGLFQRHRAAYTVGFFF